LPPDPIALLAGPARWRWIAQCEGEFVVPLGWHGARRLRDHLLNCFLPPSTSLSGGGERGVSCSYSCSSAFRAFHCVSRPFHRVSPSFRRLAPARGQG